MSERTLFHKSVNSQSKFSRDGVSCDLGLTKLLARGSQLVAWWSTKGVRACR